MSFRSFCPARARSLAARWKKSYGLNVKAPILRLTGLKHNEAIHKLTRRSHYRAVATSSQPASSQATRSTTSGEKRNVSELDEAKETEAITKTQEETFSYLHCLWEEAFLSMSTFRARQLSRLARSSYKSSTGDLTYGEVTFSSLANILCKDLVRHGVELKGSFYDLGSGSGRGVIAAALLGHFNRVCGIEMLNELHQASVEVQEVYEAKIAPKLSLDSNQKVEFLKGNLLGVDWHDASVIFINSTCFSGPLMAKISKKANKLKPGACIVTLSQRLSSPHYELVESKIYPMSWGDATAHIHIRRQRQQGETGDQDTAALDTKAQTASAGGFV